MTRLGRAQAVAGALQRTLQKEAQLLSAIAGLQSVLERLHVVQTMESHAIELAADLWDVTCTERTHAAGLAEQVMD